MDKISYKYSLVMAYASSCNPKNGDRLFITTSAGIIEGTFVNSDIEESLKSDIVYNFFDGIDKNARKISDSPSDAILLKDAVVKSHSQEFNFKFLHVFINEIVAITIGNTSESA